MEDTLKRLVEQGFSTRQIANHIGWTQNKVCRILKKYNLKTRFTNQPKTLKRCIFCKTTLIKKSQKKFCSLQCQLDFYWQRKVRKIQENNSRATPNTLKKYFNIELGIIDCQVCGQKPIWNQKPLVMQLDHIDGNSDNNSLENLRLVCPNCHTQTPTFSSKGKGSRYKKKTKRNTYLRKYKHGIS